MGKESFEWDTEKDLKNQLKHGVSFEEAQLVFKDPNKVILRDKTHSINEERHFCIGKTDEIILTVRFTYRENRIRIIGAGAWRRGKKLYEEKNRI
ncbi:MAG: BrnT family toxin [Proteobacteria bacterium]|nr:BrnT family toxin [Pseudomonadota bacterium]NOG59422.1 BrnT family toxin [Pseudomonadota bacterium]